MTKDAAKLLTLALAFAFALGLVSCVRKETNTSKPENGSGVPGLSVGHTDSRVVGQSPVPTPTRKEANSRQVDAMPAKTAEADSTEKAQETQERRRLREEFKEISAKIAELREGAKNVTSTRTRERVAAAVAELEERRQAVAEQFENLDDWRTSASLAWQDMRTGLERALQELRQAYDKAKSHF
ncbi:MAG: hypothetical protein N2Z21_05395 [Candidatus Sumerlaeaceae bacterium]|nr:hypothetical protein [Candidatus Sumerlaeaceae bacterium]